MNLTMQYIANFKKYGILMTVGDSNQFSPVNGNSEFRLFSDMILFKIDLPRAGKETNATI